MTETKSYKNKIYPDAKAGILESLKNPPDLGKIRGNFRERKSTKTLLDTNILAGFYTGFGGVQRRIGHQRFLNLN